MCFQEAAYRIIPDSECQIDTELTFSASAELCLAHFFKRPRVAAFRVDEHNGAVLPQEMEVTQGQSDSQRFYADDRLKVIKSIFHREYVNN
jgi:hypothetical protein